MKSGKFLFIAMIFIVSLLCISAVSAADDAASDVIADTNDETILEESIDDVDLGDSEIDELGESDEIALDSAADDTTLGVPAPPPFSALDEDINGNSDPVVTLTRSYVYLDDGYDNGVTISRNVTIDGDGNTISGYYRGRIFIVAPNLTVTFKNINFVNGYTGEWGYGAAIWALDNSNVKAINCNFTNNNASYGGAIAYVDVINCTFTGNEARINDQGIDSWGGAMYLGSAVNCTFINNSGYHGGASFGSISEDCSFTGNSANEGGAVYGGSAVNCTFNENHAVYGGAIDGASNVVDCTFNENYASESGGALHYVNPVNCIFENNYAINGVGGAILYGDAVNCTFTGNEAQMSNGGAIYSGNAEKCTFINNIAFMGSGGAIYDGNAVNCTFTGNSACNGGAIYLGYAENCTFTNNGAESSGGAMSGNYYTNERCYATNCIFSGNVAPTFGVVGDDNGGAIYLGAADSCVFNGDSCKDVIIYLPTLSVDQFTSTYNSGDKVVVNLKTHSGMPIVGAKIVISVYTAAGAFVGNYNASSNVGWKVPFNAGSYKATYIAQDFDIDSDQGLILINKAKTAITSKAVTAVYNNNKYLVITLKDGKGRVLSGIKLTVTLGTAKTYKTDKNGQIKINVGKLVPKTYTAKIKYAGTANYEASTKSVKVVVKKATPKLTAKAKSFKAKLSTKKYTITLKNNKGKVMKNTKVTLKVNKKTFTAKTNSKGVATFKITNLKKKGKFTATIKYAGSNYYNKLTKKVTITIT